MTKVLKYTQKRGYEYSSQGKKFQMSLLLCELMPIF